MLEDAIRRKTEDLVRRADNLNRSRARSAADIARGEGWITEALNIIELAIPIENNAFRRRIRGIEQGGGDTDYKVGSIAECFRALLPDIDAELIADFGNKVRAETFDDFLDHAETYCGTGEKQAAGGLAG